MTPPSPTYVTRLITELFMHTDLENLSIPNLEILYVTVIDVLQTDPYLLSSVHNFSSHHQKMEELIGPERCQELRIEPEPEYDNEGNLCV